MKKLILAGLLVSSLTGFAQLQLSTDADGAVVNTVTTALPFLRINPDPRAGGMGDVALATPADPNSIFANPAKMAFLEKDFGVGVAFSPWLKGLVNDIYLASLSGYYKIKELQTIQIGFRYFSMGNIQFTDNQGQSLGQFRPNEFAIEASYSRRLAKGLSLSAGLRYIYSNLAGGYAVDGNPINPAHAGAGDISLYYIKNFKTGPKMTSDFSLGFNLSNIGNKVSYSQSTTKDFIPANLGIGFGYLLNIDAKNGVGLYMDVNKLLVPTPVLAKIDSIDINGDRYEVNNPNYDKDGNGIADFREKSVINGLFTSFGDAPGVQYIDANGNLQTKKGTKGKEELREYNFGVGLEYMYNKQFGVRMGYFYENRLKGARNFLTAGLTVKYSIVGLNFSYLIPTSVQRNPLDNTLRVAFVFEFAKGNFKKKDTEAPAQEVVQPESGAQ
jgi:hypothetical protein